MPASAILDRLAPALEAAGLAAPSPGAPDRARIERAVDLVKPRARKLDDVIPQLRPFIDQDVECDPAAVAKHFTAPGLAAHLAAWRARLADVDPFEPAALEAALREVAEARGIKAGLLIHATRVAVTGQAVSPGLFEVMELVGRERAIRRIAAAEILCPAT
jgi:glutamyl-tRNA synthetase